MFWVVTMTGYGMHLAKHALSFCIKLIGFPETIEVFSSYLDCFFDLNNI